MPESVVLVLIVVVSLLVMTLLVKAIEYLGVAIEHKKQELERSMISKHLYIKSNGLTDESVARILTKAS